MHEALFWDMSVSWFHVVGLCVHIHTYTQMQFLNWITMNFALPLYSAPVRRSVQQ